MDEFENDDELERFRQEIENSFKNLLNNGEDVSGFLYFPYELLSDNIKRKLDIFLAVEAYKQLESGNISTEKFIVYEDELSNIEIEEKDKQLKILENMITYFTSTEEYEKCARIKALVEIIQNK